MMDRDRGDRERGDRDDKPRKRKMKRSNFRKKRPPADLTFDYKRVYDLLPFVTEEGKIIPGRVSGLRASQQRELTVAIRRARHLAFISPIRRFVVGQYSRD